MSRRRTKASERDLRPLSRQTDDYWDESVYDMVERDAQADRRADQPDPFDFGIPTRAEAEADERG